ncbi:hypothetical protein R1sor_009405 [Riccia sorocarpa]|uniref:Checkpoint protein n=1 Tax=Riccia sorocarpa TaxID=122646 RepID=A0ABD3I161_9MARC
MKFRAVLTDHGVNLLERRFLPALEKIGKTCHILLTPHYVILLHNVLNTSGVQAIAQFTKEAIFEDYRISSQYDDRIAFTVDLALLSRALRSSVSMDGDLLQIKLVKKRAKITDTPTPYLTIESKGFRSAVVQDVPITQPMPRREVDELQAALDMAQDLPRTLVQVPNLLQLTSLVERLKNVGDVLEVGVTQYGDLHLHVSTTLVSIGSEFRSLRVLGVRADSAPVDANLNSSERLREALNNELASVVKVDVKQFVKSLQCHHTKPDASFCGIAPNDGCLLMMFQFFIPGTRQTDNSISLHYRLPVLLDGIA